jgi:hypothetical protein
MYPEVVTFFQYPVVRGAIAGAIAAANVDFQAFRSWKSYYDAETYSWSTASFRWLQGAVLGGLAAAGIAGLTS